MAHSNWFIIVCICLPCVLVNIARVSAAEGLKNKERLKAERLPDCQACRLLVDSFKKGIDRTARFKFDGGDAAWEEGKLGKYANSEVRLTEIQEELCKDVVKGNDQCHLLASEYEESIEKWWFDSQKTDPDLFVWLCIDNVKVCCPPNTYGTECSPCPNGLENPCTGNGKCRGEGTRKGTGECRCNKGYGGDVCNQCSTGFFEEFRDETRLVCGECHQACQGHCRDGTSKGCEVCMEGWLNHPELGCQDIDECISNIGTGADPLCPANRFCVNTEGSYQCLECHSSCKTCIGHAPDECIECKSGFSKKEGLCMASHQLLSDSDAWWRSIHTQWGRYLTYFGLCLATFIIFKKSVMIASAVGSAVALYIGLSEYFVDNSSSSPEIRFLPTSSE